MRHRKLHYQLGRPTNQRKALLRNLAHALIMHERIRTTKIKAKALRGMVERLVNLGKDGSVHSRRRALSILARKDAVDRLFHEIAPLFGEHPGGCTRIIAEGQRRGDGAEMVFIEFVKRTEAHHEKQEEKRARRERKKEEAKKSPPPQM